MSPELDDIRLEFRRFGPSYAQDEAGVALDKIVELQSQGLVRSGLYYLVLVDIVGSTEYHSLLKSARRLGSQGVRRRPQLRLSGCVPGGALVNHVEKLLKDDSDLD